MKFKNIIIVMIIIAFAGSAFAYVTNDELTSPEALVNYNYSPVMADHVQLVKAQNSNREYKSYRHSNKPWWRKVWEYIDFSTDDGYLLQKPIELNSSWQDR